MSEPKYNLLHSVCANCNRTTYGVIAVIAAVVIIVGAAYSCNNSIGSDTSGDDTRPVVNNVLPATDMNAPAPTAPTGPARPSPALPLARP